MWLHRSAIDGNYWEQTFKIELECHASQGWPEERVTQEGRVFMTENADKCGKSTLSLETSNWIKEGGRGNSHNYSLKSPTKCHNYPAELKFLLLDRVAIAPATRYRTFSTTQNQNSIWVPNCPKAYLRRNPTIAHN